MKTFIDTQLFILIDDDPINNSISRLTIVNTISAAEIIVFTDPKSGLSFLTENFVEHPSKSGVLLLNLNMPFMSGWEFLEQFAALKRSIQDRIRMYILSSSIDQADRTRSERMENVRGFLNKPLSPDLILSL